MFSTVRFVEKRSRYVENVWESHDFAWKTMVRIVEKSGLWKRKGEKTLKPLYQAGFRRNGQKAGDPGRDVEKTRKKFFLMWKNMWKVLQSA